MVLDALETLQNEELGHTLIAGANVQEEVGLRGSKPSVHKFNQISSLRWIVQRQMIFTRKKGRMVI